MTSIRVITISWIVLKSRINSWAAFRINIICIDSIKQSASSLVCVLRNSFLFLSHYGWEWFSFLQGCSTQPPVLRLRIPEIFCSELSWNSLRNTSPLHQWASRPRDASQPPVLYRKQLWSQFITVPRPRLLWTAQGTVEGAAVPHHAQLQQPLHPLPAWITLPHGVITPQNKIPSIPKWNRTGIQFPEMSECYVPTPNLTLLDSQLTYPQGHYNSSVLLSRLTTSVRRDAWLPGGGGAQITTGSQ